METKPGVPDIHPEVMRSSEHKKEGALALLLAKLGFGGSGGATAFAGGLFASKAGIVALALVGSSVAAGIGILATKPEGAGGLRAARPQEGQSMFASLERDGESMAQIDAAASQENAGAASSGASNSLDFLQQANKPEAPKEAAASSEKVADAAASAPGGKKDSGVQAPEHGSGSADASAQKSAARPVMAKGEGFGGRAGGSSSLQLQAQAGLSGGINGGFEKVYRAPVRQTSGMEGSNRSTAQASRRSAVAKGGLASKQAADTMRMTNLAKGSRSAASSAQFGGATYDGTGGSGNQIGGTSAPPSSGGMGTDGKGVDGAVNPNTAENLREVPKPPEADKTENKTPYQHLVTRAMIAMAVAGIALFAASATSKKAKEANAAGQYIAAANFMMYTKILAGIATAAGGLAAITGIQLTQDPYNQMGQGMMFAMIGGILTFQAAMVLFNDEAGSEADKGVKDTSTKAATDANVKLGEYKGFSTSGDKITANYSNGSMSGAADKTGAIKWDASSFKAVK